MRTNIEINDELMAKAMEVGGLPTKKATVDEALRMFVEEHGRRKALEELRGIGWEGDLEEMRLSFGGHGPK